MKILTSSQDQSVNFVRDGREARYVRRSDDYFIVYMSSHNGCNKACRFCHLTQTGQTEFGESSVAEMLAQADDVLAHYSRVVASGRQVPAQKIHFNWMARGEPLSSQVVLQQWSSLVDALTFRAAAVGITDLRFNVSTIMPADLVGDLEFEGRQPTIYYSLYSVDPGFRRRWLPKAMPPDDALARIARWQQRTAGEVVLHWAFIEGENDSATQFQAALDAVSRHGIQARFNMVRYNPYSDGQGQEPAEAVLNSRLRQAQLQLPIGGSKIVPRVGFDVHASCGMFVVES